MDVLVCVDCCRSVCMLWCVRCACHDAPVVPVVVPQNVRHHKVDGTQPVFQIPDKVKPNLPLTMYPDPEVAPHTLVYRINDDIEYQVDVEEYNGCVAGHPSINLPRR